MEGDSAEECTLHVLRSTALIQEPAVSRPLSEQKQQSKEEGHLLLPVPEAQTPDMMELIGSWRSAMIHFCLAHTAYHLSRWLPKPHRLRLQFAIFVLGLSALLLQLYVLLRPRSSRYCSQPLLYNLVGSIVFTFFTIGLALLLVLMEPVPGELKTLLSLFGVGSFVEGVCTTVFTALATQCARTTPELYYLSVVMSASSLISAAFFSILGIFWLANMVSPGVILNKQAKTGICYEPVSECSCLWHI